MTQENKPEGKKKTKWRNVIIALVVILVAMVILYNYFHNGLYVLIGLVVIFVPMIIIQTLINKGRNKPEKK